MRHSQVRFPFLAALFVCVLSAPAWASDSKLWAWGGNASGQLGLGDTNGRLLPAEVAAPSAPAVTSVVAGGDHTLIVTADGKLWACGYNYNGQLGLSDYTDRSTATEVTALAGMTVVAAAAGAGSSYAQTSDGRTWAWGANSCGQLGLGDTTDRNTPTEITALSGKSVIAVTAGYIHAMALTSDGKLWAWGHNGNGALGLGDWQDRYTPTQIAALAARTVTAVSLGAWFSLAVTADGKLWAWGNGGQGQLGLGDTGMHPDPMEVTALAGLRVNGLAAGRYHTLVTTSDGRLWSCGDNQLGQLGLGDTDDRDLPTEVAAFSGRTAVAIAAGDYHSLALGSDGRVWAWGRNASGQLGLGDTSDRTVPTEIVHLSDHTAVALAACGDFALALSTSDQLLGWGSNGACQLGLGDSMVRNMPTALAALSGRAVSTVAGGMSHTIAADAEGSLWAWGGGSYGELGLGDWTGRSTPNRVPGLAGRTVVRVAAGLSFSLATTSEGNLFAWGCNTSGQLGLGDWTNRNSPELVKRLEGRVVSHMSAGESHALAVASDGRLWSWGANVDGQLGLGDNTWRDVPTEVTALGSMTVTVVAAGYNCSFAVTSDGRLWAWGYNGFGNLGLGDTVARTAPVEVTALAGRTVVAVAAKGVHALAVTADGQLWALGANGNGQLGLGDWTGRDTPVEVSALTGRNVVDVASGGWHTLILTSDRRLWGCGSNAYGQLGLCDATDRNTPTQIAPIAGKVLVALAGGWEHSVAAARSNSVPVAQPQSVTTSHLVPASIVLSGSDANGDPLTYHIVSGPSHGSLTGTPPSVTYTNDDTHSGSDSFTFKVNDGFGDSAPATVSIMIDRLGTKTTTLDRTGIMTELTILRGYLRRSADNAWIMGRTITFKIDGTEVGTGVTDANGHAPLNWRITGGTTTRTITAEYAGEAAYLPSSGNATLTALTSGTKMVVFDRTGRITQYTIFKAVLFRTDNSPLPNKTISFSIDGTPVGSDVTRANGEAKVGYIIPSGAGAGTRSILHEFAGDAGYAAISRTRTLTVQRALPYIWTMSRSCLLGHKVALYAYFRRLYDYQKQPGKTVDFRIDGTLVHTMQTNADGVAYYIYQTVEPKGAHTIRCEFAGDAWVEPGAGEGTLTIL